MAGKESEPNPKPDMLVMSAFAPLAAAPVNRAKARVPELILLAFKLVRFAPETAPNEPDQVPLVIVPTVARLEMLVVVVLLTVFRASGSVPVTFVDRSIDPASMAFVTVPVSPVPMSVPVVDGPVATTLPAIAGAEIVRVPLVDPDRTNPVALIFAHTVP